jgi:hypothetical protein
MPISLCSQVPSWGEGEGEDEDEDKGVTAILGYILDFRHLPSIVPLCSEP